MNNKGYINIVTLECTDEGIKKSLKDTLRKKSSSRKLVFENNILNEIVREDLKLKENNFIISEGFLNEDENKRLTLTYVIGYKVENNIILSEKLKKIIKDKFHDYILIKFEEVKIKGKIEPKHIFIELRGKLFEDIFNQNNKVYEIYSEIIESIREV